MDNIVTSQLNEQELMLDKTENEFLVSTKREEEPERQSLRLCC